MDISAYITVKDAASIIGCTSRHVRWLCDRGDLDCEVIGNIWLVVRDSARRVAREVPNVGRPRGPHVPKEKRDSADS